MGVGQSVHPRHSHPRSTSSINIIHEELFDDWKTETAGKPKRSHSILTLEIGTADIVQLTERS